MVKGSAMKFTGSLAQLQDYLSSITEDAVWSGSRNHIQCRFPNGAVLNWWMTTGTIQVQGPDAAAEALENALFELSNMGWPERLPASGNGRQKGEQVRSLPVTRSTDLKERGV